ncbi:hypothetical protein CDD81_5824 [Ophiocordyceps australis]|uniref:Protection of telomeres protein 1 n=1 Tax=Ophiocordyceps australis TaxID=1399860 RepID=A0A2C5Y1S3_9HYPO|nr:hypothetical protein CDD81_5824 [Ophiocordyceps australis]
MAQPKNDHLLPPSFSTIRDILNGRHPENSLVNVAGLVMDYRAPIKTKGTDYKCEIRLFDQSVENQDDSICLNIFRPCDEIPFAGCGDVVLLFRVKVQCRPDVSLVTNRSSDIYTFDANSIPRPPADASRALRCMDMKKHHTLNPTETTFVSSLYHRADKSRMPTKFEFAEKVKISANVKEKVKLLRDVSDSTFADIVGRVVKEPFDDNERITLWISDYTENEAFFNFSYKGGDMMGMSGWTGPFGKRSIQITCYEPHASFIQSSKLRDCWVYLRNVHIKYGKNGCNLEGFLRGDRTPGQGRRTGVQRLDHLQDRESLDPRLVDAIRRKRDYERSQAKQLEEITEAAMAGQRRKAALAAEAEPLAKKKKTNRYKDRAARFQPAAKQEASAAVTVADINSQVKCEHLDKPVSLVSDMLKPQTLKTSIDGSEVALELPFTNHNYRANMHVVDFAPCDLRRFARPVYAKADEYQALSDNDSVSSANDCSSSPTSSAAPSSWEWRFFLKLQDATPSPSPRQSLWVLVDNQAAQCLINLDATDLTRHPDALHTLRERLFILWGELEEHKSRARDDAKTRGPPDSDDEQLRLARRHKVLNRPFACCVCQFGVRVRERDEARANAGARKRWQRVFALFGTKIVA